MRIFLQTITMMFALYLCFFNVTVWGQNYELYNGQEVESNTILIKYEPEITVLVDGEQVQAGQLAGQVKSRLNARVTERFKRSGIEVWQIDGDLDRALRLARSIPGAIAVPNYVVELERPVEIRPFGVNNGNDEEPPVNDTFFEHQWSLYNDGTFEVGAVTGADIDAVEAWQIQNEAITADNDTIIVVVFDTGIDKEHEDLHENLLNGYHYDAYNDNFMPEDGNGHGTHVAGTIGAMTNNETGIAGVAHTVKIIDVRIFNDEGSTTTNAIFRGYEYISELTHEQGLRIVAVNQSWGGWVIYENQDLIDLYDLNAQIHGDGGTIWVVSAGNANIDMDNINRYNYPATLRTSNVINVTSTDWSEERSGFSNYGQGLAHIGAPGTDILSTIPDDRYASMSGTSMASPHVTGVLALIAAKFPDETYQQLVSRLFATGDRKLQYEGLWQTGARINLKNALMPSELTTDDLIASNNKVHFHLTLSNESRNEIAGFINNTDQEITVQSVEITGEDADLFESGEYKSNIDGGEAFGVVITFSEGDRSKEFYSAELTIQTNIGTVAIDLDGRIQQYPFAELTPLYAEYEHELVDEYFEHQQTLANQGAIDLEFSAFNFLEGFNEPSSEQLTRVKKTTGKVSSVWQERDLRQTARRNFEKIRHNMLGLDLQHFSFDHDRTWPQFQSILSEEFDDDLELLYFQDFNDPDDVDWGVVDAGEGDVWRLFDISGEEEPVNNVVLAGDFEEGYSDETVTAAVSPVFDFQELAVDASTPYYLQFDYAAELAPSDFFYIMVAQENQFIALIALSGDNLNTDGNVHTALLDISFLHAENDISFWFIADYNSEQEEMFGSMFTDVGIWIGPAPFYLTQYSGSVEPDDALNISMFYNPRVLGIGVHELYTLYFSNAGNNGGFLWSLAEISIESDELIDDDVVLFENFNLPAFPPDGWNRYNVDGGAWQWDRMTDSDFVYSGNGAAFHDFDDELDQDGWLVTPQIELDQNSSLSFYDYVFWDFDYRYSGVFVSTGSGDPQDEDFVEVAEFDEGTDQWTERVVDLSDYDNENIYIAFVYRGLDGHGWIIDNITVKTSPVVSVSRDSELPRDFTLMQNYPNPFNPSTVIRYGIAQQSPVSLTVYNLLGQQVVNLVDEVQSAGYYEVTFDAGRLASGVYLYRLQAGDYVETKKLMFLK